MDPATKPATRPGFSAIEKAMNPAKIGSMKANAAPPILLKSAATSL